MLKTYVQIMATETACIREIANALDVSLTEAKYWFERRTWECSWLAAGGGLRAEAAPHIERIRADMSGYREIGFTPDSSSEPGTQEYPPPSSDPPDPADPSDATGEAPCSR